MQYQGQGQIGCAARDSGHWIAHRAYGNDVGIRLDPFGGSRIIGGSVTPRETWGITSAAGSLLNVVMALTVTLALWRWLRPILLPLLLWGPIALVQEGVTFSLGLLTAGGDASLPADLADTRGRERHAPVILALPRAWRFALPGQ